jgi:Tfp pilus assembly protein PilF
VQLEDWLRAEVQLKQVQNYELTGQVIALAELGYIYLRQHKCELALDTLQTAIQRAKDLKGNLHVTAWVNGDFSKTKIELFPQRPAQVALVARSNLATTYLLSGQSDAAFETIQEAIASAPQDNIGYRVSGCLRLAQGEVEPARSDWNKALSLAEDKHEAALIEGWLAALPPIQK